MAEETLQKDTKVYAPFVYNSETEKAEDAKQIVLTKRGEFAEVTATNGTHIRLRTTKRELMEDIVSALRGVYPEPNVIVIREIVATSEDRSEMSGEMIVLPSDRTGAMRLSALITHAATEFKKQINEQIHQLKNSYLSADRNATRIGHAIVNAARARHE